MAKPERFSDKISINNLCPETVLWAKRSNLILKETQRQMEMEIIKAWWNSRMFDTPEKSV